MTGNRHDVNPLKWCKISGQENYDEGAGYGTYLVDNLVCKETYHIGYVIQTSCDQGINIQILRAKL